MATFRQDCSDAQPRVQKMISPLLQMALLLGLLLHLVGFLIFRVVSNPLPDKELRQPYVDYVSAGSLAKDRGLEEQLELFDSSPLFIPTRWNAAQLPMLDLERTQRSRLPDFEPEIDLLGDLQPASVLVADEVQVEQPLDLLASRFWRLFDGFAASAKPIAPFPEQSSVAEVTVVGQGLDQRRLIAASLRYAMLSAVQRPVLCYLRISGNGMALGAPILAESSGNDAFDHAVTEWLSRSDLWGQLPPGYLSIQVFPGSAGGSLNSQLPSKPSR